MAQIGGDMRSGLSFSGAPATSAEGAQAKLIAALATPGGRGDVEIAPIETAGAAIRRAAIFAKADGARIGAIENFQVDFVRPGMGDTQERLQAEGGLPRTVDSVAEWRLTPHTAESIRYDGPRTTLGAYDMVAIEPPGAVSCEASGEIEALLFAHPWSGEAEIRTAKGKFLVDLYAPHTVVPRPLKLELGETVGRVEIVATGRKNALSAGAQCLFGGFRERTGRLIPLRHRKQAKARGAAFTAEFQQLLASVPDGGLLLDVGGGNRQVDDSRYINLDYAAYDEPDLIGDATSLPLRDGSIDAVYSTGVFEHIDDPLRAGAEVARVLKPGGKAIVGWAFMQPIHSEGQHFYNATPWGLERAFSGLKVKRQWYETSFAFLVRWGASVSGLHGRVPDAEVDGVCETLQRWDALIPETHKAYMANGVWAEFEKV
jgi:SAM-dependent methyltransferase